MRYFVTGTDTDVGKTVVCAWLALHLRAAYWKPVQCGFEAGDGDRERVTRLSGCETFPERYRFELARSPHVAAAAEATVVDLESILLPAAPRLIVEGAGGVFVPLNADELMIDLIHACDLPVIVVARGVLGGINHLLLTLAALRQYACTVAGVIFTGPCLPETVDAAMTYGKTRVLANLPQLERVDGPALRAVPIPEPLLSTANDARR